MEAFWNDIRLGARALARSPGFTLAAVSALTLGIGATSAMVLVVNGVLLQALPYDDPGHLVVVTGTYDNGGEVQDWPISQTDFKDWREQNRSFESLAVYTPDPLAYNLLGEGEPERLTGELVSQEYFQILGLEPEIGRFFTPEEDSKPFGHAVAVISYGFWADRFGRDPGVVGHTLRLNGTPYQVVGVAPEGFQGLTDRAQVWVPSMMPPGPDFLKIRRFRWVAVVARLAPGVTVEQAQHDMDAITSGLAEELPDSNRGIGATVTSLREHWFGRMRYGLLILLGGAAILLLIACVNVANLLMTRAVEREKMVAVRTALGASRARLIRQMLTESVLLVGLGATLGLLLASWATRLLVAISGVRFQSFIDFGLDPLVVGVILAVSVVCCLVFGAVPLSVSLKSDLTQALEREGKNPLKGLGRQGFQSSVVIAQVALALVLSVGAGLMAKGFKHLLSEDLGYQPKNLLSLRIDLKGERWSDDADVIRLVERFLDRLEPLPGVGSLAIAGPTIPTDDWAGGYVTIEDRVSSSPDGTVPVMMHAVSPDYFSTLGAPIIAGRAFTRQDTKSFGVVVSHALAERYWPDTDPLGKRLKVGARDNPERPWLTVLGVAEDIDHAGYMGFERPAPDIYVPILQFQVRLPLILNFLVRPEDGLDAHSLVPALVAEIHEIAPDLVPYDAATFDERLAHQTEQGRFQVILVSLFTAVALILATIGIYGVVSYNVAQRTREIGIRMALGARRADVVRLIVLRGAFLAAIGLAAGLVGVLALNGAMERVLYGAKALDPLLLGGTSALLFAVTVVASYVPARRAARLEPVLGLRAE